MNYYEPRQMIDKEGKETGLYHYTRQNRRTGTFPVGYCADNCPGHPDEAGAYEHYRQYLLDTAEFNFSRLKDQQVRCCLKGCGNWTQELAQTEDQRHFMLCTDHQNRETLEKVLVVGMSISSW